MKLNPPASSSDLESAREIARRLHQHRRRADSDRSGGRRAPELGVTEPTAPARLAPWHAAEPPRRVPPVAPATFGAAPPAVPLTARAPAPPRRAPEEPEPPSWDEAEPTEAAAEDDHLAGALDDLANEGAPAARPPDAREPTSEPEAAELPSFDDDEAESPAPPQDDLPGVEVEDAGVSPDEMVGGGDLGDVGAFDEPLAGSAFDTPAPAGAEPGPTEDLFDEPPPPPSWDDVVESCREIAGASGAMIIDPAGQVFAARGDWPEPGPDAIAGRLVAMMERTLKDAPTRSVSAPVGGQHLTAWRVPLTEGLVTAAFIADSPLRSDVRSAIDAEIHRGAGA